MKYLPLIWAGVWRRPGRAALTIVSIVSAFVIFGVLTSFSSGMNRLISDSHADLLLTQSRASQVDPLPIAQLADIRRTPGVAAVTPVLFLGGPWRNPNGPFLRVTGIDPDGVRAADTALKITEAQWTAL